MLKDGVLGMLPALARRLLGATSVTAGEGGNAAAATAEGEVFTVALFTRHQSVRREVTLHLRGGGAGRGG